MIQDATIEFISLRERFEFFTFATYTTLRPDLLKSFTDALKSPANAKNSSTDSD